MLRKKRRISDLRLTSELLAVRYLTAIKVASIIYDLFFYGTNVWLLS